VGLRGDDPRETGEATAEAGARHGGRGARCPRRHRPAARAVVAPRAAGRPIGPIGPIGPVRLPIAAHRVKPIQKLKTCCWSVLAWTMGKPKSSAMGTGPSIGTVNRMPKPADTRYVSRSLMRVETVPESTNPTRNTWSLARIGNWYSRLFMNM